MAIPPTLPTSFVPPSASAAVSAYRSSVLGFLAYLILGIVFILAIGVFLYGRLLASEYLSKETALREAEAAIDPATVESFVRLRDRLASGETLLNGHTAFSGFFASLEKLLPETVRFSSLHLSTDATGVSKIEGVGSAKSFNALAAASTAFAGDGRIKDAIFSNINIDKEGSVSFILSATIDPKLVVFSP
ncbi:hypothetical protein HY412_00535 [Candidatus Kaiserbacteria bacterium]|nr:hypothetical protein [Candidatus Kaiserbacteria bacterium]